MEAFNRTYTFITRDQLSEMCPEANAKCEGWDIDDVFWVMTNPEHTNEPELTEVLKSGWNKISHNGKVYLNGHDDEYGYYWDNSRQEWMNYCY